MTFLTTIHNNGLPAHIANRQSRFTEPLMAPAGGGYPRISLKGGRFTFLKDGEEKVCNDTFINVSIVGAIPTVSRQWYKGSYDAKATEAVLPACFATDGKTPDAHAPEKQATSCDLCPKNQKGSGQGGNTKACSYKKRLFVWSDFEPSTVYTLDVGAMSLFGDGNAVNEQMNLQVYSKWLADRGLSDPSAAVTEVEFNRDASVAALLFKPTDWWGADEIAEIDRVADECADAIAAQKQIVSSGGAPAPAQAAPVAQPAPRASASVVPMVAPAPVAAPQSGRRGAAQAAPAPVAAPQSGRRGAAQAAPAQRAAPTQAPPVVVDSVATEIAALSGDDDAELRDFLGGLE